MEIQSTINKNEIFFLPKSDYSATCRIVGLKKRMNKILTKFADRKNKLNMA